MSDLFSDAHRYASDYEASSPDGEFYRERLGLVSEFLDRLLPKSPDPHSNRRLLDVGCGPGMLIDAARSRRIRFFGADLSPSMASACHERLQKNQSGHVSRASVESLPFSPATFDLVVCMGVLEYVPSICTALREIFHVTKPGGLLVASMLNPRSPYRIWECLTQPELCRIQRPYVYSERTLGSLMETSGFCVLDCAYFDFNVFLPPLDRKYARRAIVVTRFLSRLAHTPLRWLGTGFVTVAQRIPAPARDSQVP
jgi:SAM-dependent methyltransferase